MGQQIINSLNNALSMWNEKFSEIYTLIVTAPEDFRGGGIWTVIVGVYQAMRGIGIALLVLFFFAGIVKTYGSFGEIRRPEIAFQLLFRFVLAKVVVTNALGLMQQFIGIGSGVVTSVMSASGFAAGEALVLPEEISAAAEGIGIIAGLGAWLLSFVCLLVVTVLSFFMLLTVYARFFKIYIMTALAPIPLAGFAGQPTVSMGVAFIRSYAAVLLEGAVIVLACVIYSAYAASAPALDPGASAQSMIFTYMGQLIFNMLVLVGTIRLADRLVQDMIGL